MKIGELRSKEVINAADGKRFGFVMDVDVNLEDGKLEAIILKGTGKLFGFIGKDNDLVIPWEMIRKVGQDTIIVDVSEKYLKNYY